MHAARLSTNRFTLMVAALLALIAVLASGGTAAAAPGGNSSAAQTCLDGGFENYTRPDGTTFENAGQCVAYAARGGVLIEIDVVTGPSISIVLPDTSGGTHTIVVSAFTPDTAVTLLALYAPSTNSDFITGFTTDGEGNVSIPLTCPGGVNETVNVTVTDDTGVEVNETFAINC
jgi:hypothetical protein